MTVKTGKDNRLLRATLLFVMSLLCLSCEDDFYADSPSSLSQNEVFANRETAKQALYGIYAGITDGNLYGKKLSYYASLNSDSECISGSTDNGRRAMARYTATEFNTETPQIVSTAYRVIRDACECINGIDESPIRNELQDLRAEAVVLRAMLYFDLVRNFGDIPYYTSLSSEPGDPIYTEKTDRKDILSSLIEDVTDASKSLKSSAEIGSAEVITKYFAIAFAARISLYRAGCAMTDTNTPPSDYIEYYKKAHALLKEVIENGQYKLADSYQDVFTRLCRYEDESEPREILYKIGMSKGNSGELGYFVSTKHADGSKYGSSECGVLIPPSHFYGYSVTDKRRDVSCALYQYGSDGVQKLSKINEISAAKFRRDWITPALPGSQKYTGVSLPVMRYSDVLLMYAECENELNDGPTEKAIECLKSVRKRAFEESEWTNEIEYYCAKITTKLTLAEAIMRERKYEFTAEMIRKYDLQRWGILGDALRQSQAEMYQIKNTEYPFNNIPNKIYWMVGTDKEHIQIYTSDNHNVDEDFDLTSKNVKNQKWSTNVSDDFIKRMCESTENPTFLPWPKE